MPARIRNYWMDLLNVIACFSVVVLHCTTVVFANEGDTGWIICVALQSLCIFAVPIFFMISGANLLGYRSRYDTKTFFQKRCRKALFALIAGSTIVYLAYPVMYKAFGVALPYQPTLVGFIHGFLHNEICDIYWFFYAILILYLITPVFSLVVSNKKVLEYAIAICVFSSVLVPLLERFSPDPTFLNLFIVPYLSSWLTYYLLGYYLTEHNRFKKVGTAPLIIIGLTSMLLMAALTISTNAPHTVASGSFAGYDNFYANALSAFALVYSICIFLISSRLNSRIGDSSLYPAVKKLSGLSLGVYAIHIPVIALFDFFIPHRIIWDFGIRPFVVFALALLLSSVGKSIMILLHKITRKPY